ncbi:hypothetical protein M409DRAFT_23676 [Zasmidium cellare ATCC 36951]|uniref:Uncharacterized protein n=1 Tax=Zasmidium cellare ATCC 36951 TaxID=1080233 RepID=A0A6A6CKK1_ZASCE|nr:uncharacterized protein M409DRAFT_23676 [Zasmidium cellare ATCC 36951]KAF2165946.1 hypothetical protein M409DRAFT_23676 [Zasmidium cellare ATCC 36951]
MAGPPSCSTTSSTGDDHPLRGIYDIGYIQNETVIDMNPTNPQVSIHSMFRQSNFAEKDFDYSKMATSLRLLTHFIKVCLPFFHAIFLGCSKVDSDRDHKGRQMFVFTEPREKLSLGDEQLTWQRLEIMSENLTFVRPDIDDGFNATCRPLIKPGVSLGLKLLGSGSEIAISNMLYRELIESQNDPRDIVREQIVAFHFATTMLHELGHVAFFAVVPWKLYNHQVFQHQCQGHMIFLNEWPCPSKSLMYVKCGMLYATRGEDIGVEVQWRTPFVHLHVMFQDFFWNEVVPQGREILFFKKDIGYRFVAEVDGAGPPFQPHPSYTIGIPVRYFADKNGVLRKRPDKVAQLDQFRDREAELSGDPQKTGSKGVVDGWRRMTLREKVIDRTDKLLAMAQKKEKGF